MLSNGTVRDWATAISSPSSASSSTQFLLDSQIPNPSLVPTTPLSPQPEHVWLPSCHFGLVVSKPPELNTLAINQRTLPGTWSLPVPPSQGMALSPTKWRSQQLEESSTQKQSVPRLSYPSIPPLHTRSTPASLLFTAVLSQLPSSPSYGPMDWTHLTGPLLPLCLSTIPHSPCSRPSVKNYYLIP